MDERPSLVARVSAAVKARLSHLGSVKEQKGGRCERSVGRSVQLSFCLMHVAESRPLVQHSLVRRPTQQVEPWRADTRGVGQLGDIPRVVVVAANLTCASRIPLPKVVASGALTAR